MFDSKILNFGGKQLCVDVCDTESLRTSGLMGVKLLPEGCGMLFVMDDVGPASFWMKNTLIPLDIAFLDEKFRIIEIDEMEPHVGKKSCKGPVKYAVETNRGWFRRNGIAENQCITISEGLQQIRSFVNELMKSNW